jgi:GxxExxY protein
MQIDEYRLNQITEVIIGCAYRVGNALGCGFLEKVYENALRHELEKAGLKVQQQFPVPVVYDGVVVGDFYPDLLVEGTVLVELKSIRSFEDIHAAQCINYLVAAKLPICLLINFGKRVDVRRFANMQEKF